MRIYRNCIEAITDIGRELKKCASTVHTDTYQNKVIKDDPDFNTKEIQAFQFMIINTDDKDKMPNVTLEWAKAEFIERVSSDAINPGEAYKLRKEVWEQFLVDDVNIHGSITQRFNYTYNERIRWQILYIINELREHPSTRQAIIEIHGNILDLRNLGGTGRIPCSMFYQYMIRDGKLDVIYVMRSTDFATHFQNDIWLADELRRYIAKMINIPVGKFIMFASSLHVYQKDWNLLSNY